MTVYTPEILEPHDLEWEESSNPAGGAGIEPGYLSSDDSPEIEKCSLDSDSSSISPASSSSSQTSSTSQALGAEETDDPGYIPDSSRSEGNQNSHGDVSDAYDELKEELDAFKEEGFYTTDENGYPVPNGDALERYFQKLMELINYIEMMLMIAKSKRDDTNTVLKILTGHGLSEGSSIEDALTALDTSSQHLNILVTQFFKTILEEMQKIYEKALKDAEKECSGFWDQVGDFFSGGALSQRVLKKQIKATEKYEAALKKWMETFARAFMSQGVFKGQAGELERDLEGLVVRVENGYVSVDTDKLLAIREKLMGMRNAISLIAEIKLSKGDTAQMVFALLKKIQLPKSMRKRILSTINRIFGHGIELFEQTVNLKMQLSQLHNQKVYLKKQLEKLKMTQGWNCFSSFLTLAAAGLGIAAAFCSGPLGLGLAIAAIGSGFCSAVTRWGAAEYADNAVEDEYKPLVNNFIPEPRVESRSGNETVDLIAKLSQDEEEILAKVDKNRLKTIKDGYLAVDTEALAKYEEELANLQNLKDLVLEIQASRFHAASNVFQIYSGVKLDEYEESSRLAIEAQNKQHATQFRANQFKVNEIKTAHNMERQQEIAMENATRSLWVSMGAAVLSAFGAVGIAFLAGASSVWGFFAVGWGLGNAIGGAIAQLINLKASSGSSYEADFNADRIFLDMMREQNEIEEDNRMRILENSVYEDLLENGVTDAGNDFKALDVNELSSLQKRLSLIGKIQTIMAEIAEAKQESWETTFSQMAGVNVSTSRGLGSKAVNRLHQARLRKFGHLVNFLKEKISVQNRAAEASHNLDRAWWNFGINLVVGTAMCVAGALGPSSCFFLAAPLMGLINGLSATIHYSKESEKDYGELQTSLKLSQQRAKETKHLKEEAALEKLEEELFDELSKELLGNTKFNSGFFDYYGMRAENIGKGKEVLSRLLQFTHEIRSRIQRNLSGVGGRISLTEKIEYINATTLLSTVQNMITTLQTINERNNYIDRSHKLMLRSAVQFGLSALTFAASAVRQARYDELITMEADSKADDAKPENLSPEEQVEKTQEYNKAMESFRVWKAITMGLSFLNAWSGLATEKIYKELTKKDKKKGAEMIDEGKVKASLEETRDYASTISRLQLQSARLKLEAGDIQNSAQDLVSAAQFNRELMEIVGSSIQTAGEASGFSYRWIDSLPEPPNIPENNEKEAEVGKSPEIPVPKKLDPKKPIPAAPGDKDKNPQVKKARQVKEKSHNAKAQEVQKLEEEEKNYLAKLRVNSSKFSMA